MKLLWLSACAAFALDQISKYIVVHAMNLLELGHMAVVPPLLTFRMGWNDGINFGLMSGDGEARRWFLIAMTLVVVGLVIFWAHKERANRFLMLSFGLIVGGALGNVVDRWRYGAVADFLNVSCCGLHNPYAFNLADVLICAGAVGLIFSPRSIGRP